MTTKDWTASKMWWGQKQATADALRLVAKVLHYRLNYDQSELEDRLLRVVCDLEEVAKDWEKGLDAAECMRRVCGKRWP